MANLARLFADVQDEDLQEDLSILARTALRLSRPGGTQAPLGPLPHPQALLAQQQQTGSKKRKTASSDADGANKKPK